RKASSASPRTLIFFGGPSRSGSSSDSRTGSQNRRRSSPIGVPAPLSVNSLLSSALSIASHPLAEQPTGALWLITKAENDATAAQMAWREEHACPATRLRNYWVVPAKYGIVP